MATFNGGYASIAVWCNGLELFEGGNRGANGASADVRMFGMAVESQTAV